MSTSTCRFYDALLTTPGSMGPLLLLVSLWSLPVTRSASNTTSELTFSHHLVLDREERVQLSWRPDSEGVTFRYSVATHGYIGLGFSPGGGMHGADIMLAWVDTGGGVHVTDRHAVGNNVPYLDTRSQDYKLISGYENDTHTVVTFSRVWTSRASLATAPTCRQSGASAWPLTPGPGPWEVRARGCRITRGCHWARSLEARLTLCLRPIMTILLTMRP